MQRGEREGRGGCACVGALSRLGGGGGWGKKEEMGRRYLRSRSWMPVTRFCAYMTISPNRYAKLARLSSAVRLRFRLRS